MEKKKRTGSEIAPSRAAVADAQSVEASIRARIFTIRGVQVMLDRDLAALYGVEVKQLNRQVKRNAERFPDDFMFQLSREECLRCQFGTLNGGRGQHLKYFPYVFTENGVAMLSSVLRSPGAIAANIQIMRAFNAMRKALAEIAPVLSRLAETERRQLEDRTRQLEDQARNEERFETIFKATSAFHDRFLILDGKELYHFGASLKDLGRRYCAVSKMDAAFIPSILARI